MTGDALLADRAYDRAAAQLVLDLHYETEHRAVWWADQIDTLRRSTLLTSWAQLVGLVEQCARAGVAPTVVLGIAESLTVSDALRAANARG